MSLFDLNTLLFEFLSSAYITLFGVYAIWYAIIFKNELRSLFLEKVVLNTNVLSLSTRRLFIGFIVVSLLQILNSHSLHPFIYLDYIFLITAMYWLFILIKIFFTVLRFKP